MPAPYGVTATGFSAKTLEEILEEIRAACRSDISPIVNLSTRTVLGQYNGIISSKLAELWELAQIIVGSFDPASASDAQLSNLAMLTGTLRNDATASVVECDVNLDAGAYLAGTLIASVVGDPTARFANRDDVTSFGAPLTGVIFEALETGPIEAPAGTLTVKTPVVGWNSVTNPTDAALGSNVESDPALRLRRAAELAAAGSASDLAMLSAVSAVDGVQSVSVISNDTDEVDENGLPPHSQEIVVYDGLVPAADDDAIAQAIWDNKTGAIAQIGNEYGTASDAAGADQRVYFTRVSVVPMYVEVDLEYLAAAYIGDTEAISQLKDWGDANLAIGTDVRINRIIAAVLGMAGVQDVTAVRIGTGPSPSGTVNYPITGRQIAAFDTSRIVINSVLVEAT